MDGLASFYQITLYLLPSFGIVLLLFLIVLVFRFIKASGKINEILEKGKTTVDSVNSTLKEIEKPLATVAKISGGVDLLYGYGEKTFKKFIEQLSEAFSYLKQWLSSLDKNKKEEISDDEL